MKPTDTQTQMYFKGSVHKTCMQLFNKVLFTCSWVPLNHGNICKQVHRQPQFFTNVLHRDMWIQQCQARSYKVQIQKWLCKLI
ncbi:hypothetical protein GDO78_007255 [Eleutherodactylus coqui]|uniref:Uncharacterized protein n=1 Tax=Eleutherodactylus coqui TaxID=57060 RepID=A0A8J6KCJ5_ELECQ|nr:hypothetical protein GDO78_007255 [Eleutherodactylus coqui]